MAYIYPECPSCGNKASGDNGLDVHEMPSFTWFCPECRTMHEGYFGLSFTEVDWRQSREPTLRERLVQWTF